MCSDSSPRVGASFWNGQGWRFGFWALTTKNNFDIISISRDPKEISVSWQVTKYHLVRISYVPLVAEIKYIKWMTKNERLFINVWPCQNYIIRTKFCSSQHRTTTVRSGIFYKPFAVLNINVQNHTNLFYLFLKRANTFTSRSVDFIVHVATRILFVCLTLPVMFNCSHFVGVQNDFLIQTPESFPSSCKHLNSCKVSLNSPFVLFSNRKQLYK